MQMCMPHWEMLTQEIKDQGLADLVSANGEIAAMRVIAELNGQYDENEKLDFDPLMRANNMIMIRVLDMVGLISMTEDFGCPICWLNAQRTEDGRCNCSTPECSAKESGSIKNFETWLKGPDSCVTSIKQMCAEKGWL